MAFLVTSFVLEIIDEDSLAYLSKFPQDLWAQEATRALQIGIAVLNKLAINNDIHYLDAQIAKTLSVVEDSFTELAAKFHSDLAYALDPHRDESYLALANRSIAQRTDDLATSLNMIIKNAQDTLLQQLKMVESEYNKIDYKLDPNNDLGYLGVIQHQILDFERKLNGQFNETDAASFIGKLRMCVGQYFGDKGEVAKTLDSKLSLDLEGKTPLGQLFLGLKTEIALLRDTVVRIAAKQELLEQTSKKGFIFEEVVLDRLEQIAKPHSDVVEDVSLKSEALTNSKKGDFVYTFTDTGVKVVLDAKNYGKLKSLPAMLSYIKEAIKEREAKFGIIVAPDEKSLQKQIGSWNTYNNCIVCALDHLDVALKYAKYYSQILANDRVDINVGAVQLKLEEISRKLKEFTNLKSKLTKLSNGVASSVQEIQTLLDDIKVGVQALIEEIELELKKG